MQVAFAEPAARWLLVEYYTDPLCGRSWAFEPHWQRLRAEFGHRFAWCCRLPGPTGSAPASSYLACLAVKCAAYQSQQAGELYLGALREAALGYGRDIARPEVLVAVADELAAQVPGLAERLRAVFDGATRCQNLTAKAGAEALRKDRCQAGGLRLRQVPTLVLRRSQQPDQVVVLSDQPYEALLHELAQAAPDHFYVPSLVEGGAG